MPVRCGRWPRRVVVIGGWVVRLAVCVGYGWCVWEVEGVVGAQFDQYSVQELGSVGCGLSVVVKVRGGAVVASGFAVQAAGHCGQELACVAVVTAPEDGVVVLGQA